MKLSAVVIARNEEKMIGEALESLKFCDEIIVIDNGSKDETKKISEKKGAKVFEINSSDFSEIRSFGQEKASHDYILYLDADERVSKELQEEIKKIIKEANDFSGYKLHRKNFYFGNYQWPYIEKIERLFKKEKLLGWEGKLHESPQIEGEIGELKGFILHFTHRDFESMTEKTNAWSDTEALTRYNLGHPKITWWRFPRVMITAFFNSFVLQRGFKAGVAGFLESMYQSFSIFITYAKLWELQQRDQKIKPKNEFV